MNILKRTLIKFSNGELIAFLGNEPIAFAEKLLEKSISHEEIVESIYLSVGIGLVLDSKFRAKLIERMSIQDLDEVFVSFTSQYPAVDEKLKECEHLEDRYILLKDLSELDIDCFATSLGIGDDWKEAKKNEARVDGLKSIAPSYPLYDYQSKIVNEVLALINGEEYSRGLIHLPTGAGKTRTAISIACMHLRQNSKGLVVWLADTEELCSQAANEFSNAWIFLGDRELPKYAYYADTNITLGGIDKGFLVAGLQKLNAAQTTDKKILFDHVAKHASLVIFDEAHKAIATTYRSISTQLSESITNKSFLLGLTATPGRSHMQNQSDEDKELSTYFQEKKISMKVMGYLSPINYLVSNKYLAQPEFIDVDYANTIKLSFEKDSKDKILGSLSEIDARNKKILSVIKEESEKESNIIVFACSVQHARELASCLCFMGIKATSLDSKYDDDFTRRNKVKSYLRGDIQVIINFNILTAGFDAPKTNVAVIARPVNSLVQYSQMVGRAMRGVRSGGNEECRIYTVADDIEEFRNVSAAFSHWDTLWN